MSLKLVEGAQARQRGLPYVAAGAPLGNCVIAH